MSTVTVAVLDTNVLVQALIGSPESASARVLDAYYDGRFRLAYSPDTLDELLAVLTVSHIRDRHGLSDDEILDFVASLLPYGERFEGTTRVAAGIVGDATDAKFLSLAEEAGADYLVTNDHRHLLRLTSHGRTRLVTPAEFLRRLG
ncbi:MAG TPA: putative toxin-antitoxin system toxin component, PIN family [Planctomycetaceae bacterium]